MRKNLIVSLVLIGVLVLIVASCDYSEKKSQEEKPQEEKPQEEKAKAEKECIELCNDQNDCTKDICLEENNFECKHETVDHCCGDNVCDDTETKESCSKDCAEEKTDADCDDKDVCTTDSYNAGSKACKNEPITPCCGNKICETTETSKSCSADCKDCNDHNPCTIDSYNTELKKCEYEAKEACCGDGTCSSTENCNSCYVDCTCASKKDLSNFPSLFDTEPIIIIGDDAPPEDIISANNLVLALTSNNIGTDSKLSSEVPSINGKDAIIMGNPCDNPFALELWGYPKNCQVYEEGKATIKLIATSTDSIVLLVSGHDSKATRRASIVLNKYKEYGLSGTEIEVTGTGLEDISIKKIK